MAWSVLTIVALATLIPCNFSWDGFVVESRPVVSSTTNNNHHEECGTAEPGQEEEYRAAVGSAPWTPLPDADCSIIPDEHGRGRDAGTRWAVLIAGSNGYENYRHQADICHAYQIFKKGGVKDENIIVFMYDDIAMNHENPRPGVIINRPDGGDVYRGVPKDYTKEEASLNNLFAVLLNNKSGLTGGSGKVLNSGPHDHVFIYYADHGGAGIVGMPTGEYLYAVDLIKALKKLHAANSYKRLVIYMESCESGSMFDGLLPKGVNIYATTASRPGENSYGTYCPDDRHPPPKGYDVCLGDTYSVSWLEDSDSNNPMTESLEEQYQVVKRRTGHSKPYSSHVMQYGDIHLSNDMLFTYTGSNNTGHHNSHPPATPPSPRGGNVDQRDAGLIYYERKAAGSSPHGGSNIKIRAEAQKALDDILAHRKHVDRSVDAIAKLLFGAQTNPPAAAGVLMNNHHRPGGQPLVDDWDCFKSSVAAYTQYCGPLGGYGLKYARAFANTCNAGMPKEMVARAAAYACARPP